MDEKTVFEKLHVEHIPGTEIMRDVGEVEFIHGPKSHQVQVPQFSFLPLDHCIMDQLTCFV